MAGAIRDYARRATEIIQGDPGVRDAVTGATVVFDEKRRQGYAEVDSDAWRRWAEAVKDHTLTHLDRYLTEAEAQLQANGAEVHWAADAAQARDIVTGLARRHEVRSVVKGKSMVTEEIDLNPALEEHGIEVFETDLGEYILQLLGEPPSHILGPALHKSLEQVQELFAERLDADPDGDPDTLAHAARAVLRDAFIHADMGITGGNFLVAETGTLALIENEGNIRITTSLPRVHVAVVGIEKLLPTMSDLAGFLQLTARAATGQPIGCFVSLIQGPARDPKDDGPEEVHVVLVDNGRTNVLAHEHAWKALRCVRCGACLNACPVYRQTGGHAYGHVYSGPIGSVLDPGLVGLHEAMPLPFASSLCGACEEACPVRIPIPELLLEWRREAQDEGLVPRKEQAALKALAGVATRPALYRAAGRIGSVVGGSGVARALPMLGEWARERALPRRASAPSASFGGRGSSETAGDRRGGGESCEPAGEPGVLGGDRVSDSRGRILERVGRAVASRAQAPHPGPLATPAPDDIGAAFEKRFTANGGEVVRVEAGPDHREWITELLRGLDPAVAGVAVGSEVPAELRPRLPRVAAAHAGAGVSAAWAAVAESGSLVLPAGGIRAVQLLPPVHVVWVRRVFARLGDALVALTDELAGDDPAAAVVLHSGPSKSADIGRTVVTGVHGPGRCIAVLVQPVIPVDGPQGAPCDD